MTQEVDDIIRISSIAKNEESVEIKDKGLNYINNNAKNLKLLINNVLGVTSDSGREDKFKRFGFNDYIVKPMKK